MLAFIFAVAGVTVSYKEKMKKARIEKAAQTTVKKVQATDFSRPDQFVNEPGLWKAEEGAKVETQGRKIEELERKLDLALRGKDKTNLPTGDDVFGKEKMGYGYNVRIAEEKGVKYMGHTGLGDGFASLNLYFPKEDLSLIILENVMGDSSDNWYFYEKAIKDLVVESLSKH